jgi:transcriptional regulator with XRE-family HTH domain
MDLKNLNAFGPRLKMLRVDKDLSRDDLGKILGITLTTIGRYESMRRSPSIDIVVKIARYFNVTTDYLLGLSDSQY